MPAIRSQRTRRRIGVVLSYVAMLAIVAFAVFPILWALLVSLKPESEIVSARLTYPPRTITFENYVAIWTRSNFPSLIVNSAVVTAITVAICTVVGTLAAYAIARYGHDLPTREVRTTSALVLIAVGLWVLVIQARPFNWWKSLLVAAMAGSVAVIWIGPALSDGP